MRLSTFYEDPKGFSNVVNYIQNRLTELKLSVEFSNILEAARILANCSPLAVTDLDCIVRKEDQLKAIFELKTRRREQVKYIFVNWSQWNTLKLLSEELNIPIYYIVKLQNNYCFIKINFWEKEIKGYEQTHDAYVKIPLSEGLQVDKSKLIHSIASVIKDVE